MPTKATIEKTENDVEFCQRLRLHHAVERTVVIMRHFSSNREAGEDRISLLSQH